MIRGALMKQQPYSTSASVAALAVINQEIGFRSMIWIRINRSPTATSPIQMKAASLR